MSGLSPLPSPISGEDQLHILVIDDDPAVCDLLSTVLTTAGHQVTTAASAEEGLQALPQVTYHVAFVDHNLPGLDGLILAEYLRKNNPHMQIALVTGATDPKLAARTRHLGLRYIPKPFEIAQLFDLVSEYKRGARERLQERAERADEEYASALGRYLPDVSSYFAMPGVPKRIEEKLVQRLKECLQNLRTASRYTERDRAAALAGLVAAGVLGIRLPAVRDGQSMYALYDEIMRANGKQPEFGRNPAHPEDA
jgi:DNA-binding response OmpR family regulator